MKSNATFRKLNFELSFPWAIFFKAKNFYRKKMASKVDSDCLGHQNLDICTHTNTFSSKLRSQNMHRILLSQKFEKFTNFDFSNKIIALYFLPGR